MGKDDKRSNRLLLAALAIALVGALPPAAAFAQSSDDQVTRIEYYPNGLVSSTTLPDGSFTSYVYDAAQRLTDIVDAEGNSIHYTLDNAGNRTKEEVKGEDGTLRRTMSRVYNQLGQLQTVKDAGNHPTGFTYDANGNLDTTTDALGRVADNDYDPLNRVAKTIQDVGGIAATTQFKYDAQDKLTEVIDPKGLSTKYQYNAFGNLTRLESPDTGVTVYDYDSAGNRTSALDARGELSTYTYDALNRRTSVSYADGSLNVAYTYDAVQPDCEAFESFAIGHITRMADSSGETRYCYDRFENLTRKVQVIAAQAFTVRYSYSKLGWLAAIQYPSGMEVDYVRDSLGRVTEVGLTRVGEPRQVLLTGATYHPFGVIAGWTFGNGRTMNRTLDLDYRARTILSTGTGIGGLNLGFGWDSAGNLSSVHSSAGEQPARFTFGYDALKRLTAFNDGATGVPIESYTYDATGNRTGLTNAGGTRVYAYAQNSHRLNALNGVPRTYDASGNTTSIDGSALKFGYDATGRMNSAERGPLVATYEYNGRGERVLKESAGDVVSTLYNEVGQWLGDYASDGSPIRQVVWLDSWPVGFVEGASLKYVEADHLGTPRALIDAQTDRVVWTWDIGSEAYGSSPPNEDPDLDGLPTRFTMRYPGQRIDDVSGLNYNYSRDYDPSTGRYIQSDPIGLDGGISTYAYALSQPFTLSDPDGLQSGASGALSRAFGGVAPGGSGWPQSQNSAEDDGSRGSGRGSVRVDRDGWPIFDQTNCPGNSTDECRALNSAVDSAKTETSNLGQCRPGMSRYHLTTRLQAWMREANAREARDWKCWAGGDWGHQQARYQAWKNVGECSILLNYVP